MRVWAGGRLIAPQDPVFSAVDPVPTHGIGVFETCAVDQGRVLHLDRHLRRLHRSVATLGLPEVDETTVRTGIDAVLAPGIDRVRITVGSPGGPVVVGAPTPERDPRPALVRSRWVRNERSPLAGHKSTSYAADALALAEAQRSGADEALLADTRGRLSEGATSNIWVELDGELLTPALGAGCLPGIVRELVLEHAATEGLPVREADLPWSVLDRVDAGFAISNSLRGLASARSLDGRPVASTPLIEAVRELLRR